MIFVVEKQLERIPLLYIRPEIAESAEPSAKTPAWTKMSLNPVYSNKNY